jgi:cytidylate kinase
MTKTTSHLSRIRTFINTQLRPNAPARDDASGVARGITISRQAGCGAGLFAEKLAALMRERDARGGRPWTVFDKSLVDMVLNDHHLPARLASFMPEDKAGELNDIIEDVLSLHPPAETLVMQTSETMLRLAQLGNVILVGRGGNVITAPLPGMLHVRLVGAPEQRITRLRESDRLGRKEAAERVRREDAGRRRYLKKYFGKEIEDPLLYHFVINTDWVTLDDAAKLVAAAATKYRAE